MALPKIITFELTHKCNCYCAMCRFKNKSFSLITKELDLERIKKIVKDLKETYNRFGQKLFLGLTGGEPFLKKDFLKIIEYLNKNSIDYDMVSNFSVPDKKALDKLVNYPPQQINISLDGIGRTHDLIRGKKIFNIVIKNINYLKNIYPQIKIKINCTINKYNLDQLTKMAEFAINNNLKLTFQHLNFVSQKLLRKQRLLEMQKIKEITDHEPTFYTLSKQEVSRLKKQIKRVKKIAEKNNYEINWLPDLDKNLATWYLQPDKLISKNKCDPNRLRLKPDGRIVHCENFVYGDLTKQKLEKNQ